MRKIAFLLSTALLVDSIFGVETSYNLDDVVVSASGYEQELKNAPASISIINAEDILNRPVRDLGDIVQEVPGLSTSVGKTGANSISIRGMASKYTPLFLLMEKG